jgi:hypothetical protein
MKRLADLAAIIAAVTLLASLAVYGARLLYIYKFT